MSARTNPRFTTRSTLPQVLRAMAPTGHGRLDEPAVDARTVRHPAGASNATTGEACDAAVAARATWDGKVITFPGGQGADVGEPIVAPGSESAPSLLLRQGRVDSWTHAGDDPLDRETCGSIGSECGAGCAARTVADARNVHVGDSTPSDVPLATFPRSRMTAENPRTPGVHGRTEDRARVRGAGLHAVLGTIFCGVLAALACGSAGGGEASLRERLSAASPERGQKVFRVCSACHTIDPEAAHTVGPNLRGVVGRPVAAAEGYGRYTPAMKSFGGVWSPDRLDRYLRRPMAEVEGTAMLFPGLPNAGDRADLIAWLDVNSPAPADFAPMRVAPGSATSAQGTDHASAVARPLDQPPALGVLVAAEGAEETYAYCTACHSERIVAQQGLTRPDWEELLEQMVEENGMTPIEEPDLGRILAYLAAHYGPDRPNFPKP